MLFTSILVLFFQTSLKAQNCAKELQDLIDYSKARNYLYFSIVGLGTNQSGNNWGQYASGYLTAKAGASGLFQSGGLIGEGSQYFSDRADAECPNPNPGPLVSLDPTPYWFSKTKADKLKLDISFSSGGKKPGGCLITVTLTLVTWGNAKFTFCPTCQGNFMYLLDNGMVIKFRKGGRMP